MIHKDFAFGLQPVLEALRSDQTIDRILIQRELSSSSKIQEVSQLAKTKQVLVHKVPLQKLNRITRKNHQGLIALMSAVQFMPLNNIIQSVFELGESPFILILDRITDVRNFGAICRTAECAGVHAVVIPQRGSAQINSDAMRTSSGALHYIPVCREPNLLDTLHYLKNSGLHTVACSEKTQHKLFKVDFTGPLAVLMGSEENGISPELMSQVDQVAKIPMFGKIESLNVSVACGIILFEAIRQRQA